MTANANPKGMKVIQTLRGGGELVFGIDWSPNGNQLAAGWKDGIRIWEVRSGELQHKFVDHLAPVYSMAWSPDGAILASGDARGKIILRETESWRPLKESTRHSLGVVYLAWAPDSKLLVSGSLDHQIIVWDGKTGEQRNTIRHHGNAVYGLAWAPASNLFATGTYDHDVCIWNGETGELIRNLERSSGPVTNLSWSPDGRYLAGGVSHNAIQIWDPSTGRRVYELEGHSSELLYVQFSPTDRIFASKSADGSLRIWRVDSWETVSVYQGTGGNTHGRLRFCPTTPLLAARDDGDTVIRIWELDVESLDCKQPAQTVTLYTSAKIVLVGESNVGKSCLAMRLAEDRYPEDHEHGTTHGMRFWPMEAEKFHPAAKPPEGQRRDVVLWDFGGQDEYQLVHQMFLHDTTLALVLIDPTRGRAALDEARDWNKRLEKHLGKDRAVKLLVGAKVDDARKKKLIDQHGIDGLCKECGFVGFLDLSARTGRNTKQLRKLISDALDWDQMAKTSRPELFQAIRDEIEKRRRADEIVVVFDEFDQELHTNDELEAFNLLHHEVALYSAAESGTEALRTVCKQLADQGVIVQTRLMNGDEALVLQLPVIERYAGSLIIAARNNPRGVPVLEERLLGSTRTIPLPGMTKKERLNTANERMVLECIVELMIQHGICFRHGGLLVFPTLFPTSGTTDEKLPHSVSLYYDFTGAIDNIYASLVSKLMVSEEFGEGRLRAGRVEFESGRQGVCGVRRIKRTGGLAHVDLFFSEKTKPERKDLFTRFVEEHLRLHGVDIREHEAMTCTCGEQISERIVQTRISAGEKDVVCPICERKTLIGEGAERIRKRNPETDAKMVALRKRIDEKLAEDIQSAKKVVAGEIRVAMAGDPIRILHLSDLHFTDKTNPETKLRLLLQDIRQQDEQYAAIETVEYLVVSGDMTDKGADVGFAKARQFVELLVNELGLSVERCILVPGNHDVQDRTDAYEQRDGVDGTTMLVRHPENFAKRFLPFSNGFFHPLMHREYPLRYADQGISYLYPETGIQFLTLNSAWEIDKNGRKKAGIHPDAAAGVIGKAEDERRRAIEREDLKKNQPILRIGVWHHAVAGPELMPDLGFLTQLQKAGMRLCLHGDVHEPRTELYGHRRPGREVEILGAGSFGSLAEGRPETTPKLYNMLEVVIDPSTKRHKSIRVHTRQQKKENEAWKGYHEWPNSNGDGGRFPYFDIDLTE